MRTLSKFKGYSRGYTYVFSDRHVPESIDEEFRNVGILPIQILVEELHDEEYVQGSHVDEGILVDCKA